ncbi:MAG: iron-containing alcohol dehydrogenase, partial [Pseudomonadota bacterium]
MNSFDVGRVPPITFGVGCVSEVPGIVTALGGDTVLVVADAALQELGVVTRLAEALNSAGLRCELAPEIVGEPKETLIDKLSARARASDVNLVIGIGGGAAMDAAKLIAAIAPSGTSAETYALGAVPLPSVGLPAMAIPTTAGTGSEVTRTSIVSTESGAKNWYWGEELMFAHAVLDPGLTVSLPPHLTAWTGMDAVAHALEAVTSRKSNSAGRLYGLEALRVLAVALPRAVANGDDLNARARVLWGSTVAGLALHNCSTHMGHNISHALGSLSRVHHGLATGLALKVTLPWLVARDEGAEHYALAAEALGGSRVAADLPRAFETLLLSCEISMSLPVACAGVTPKALSSSMKTPANRPMAQNAACPISDGDLDQIAEMILALPLEKAA